MKKLLLICPFFHGYEQHIKAAFEKDGFEVHLFEDTLRGRFSEQEQAAHKQVLLKAASTLQPDHVFVIKAENLERAFFVDLFAHKSIQKKVLYLWDSLSNNGQVAQCFDLFDKVFSFDFADSEQYKLQYKGLFYTQTCLSTVEVTNDFFFVGALHSDRVQRIKQVRRLFEGGGYRFDFNLLIGLKDKLKMILNGSYFSMHQDLITKGLTLAESTQRLCQSKYVIDVSAANQTGLTMRTFEVLGAGKVLITNNKNIQKETFYSTDYIVFFDELEHVDLAAKINTAQQTFERYHVNNWVKEFFA